MNAHLLPVEIATAMFANACILWKHCNERNIPVSPRPLHAYPCCGAVTTHEHVFNQTHGRCAK